MKSPNVLLSRYHFRRASLEAADRTDRKVRDGRWNCHGSGKDGGRSGWREHMDTLLGILGEIALAIYYGLRWNPGGYYPSFGDVGKLEVRTVYPGNTHLLVYPKDPPEAPYFLVTGEYPHFTVIGWFYGHEAKQDRFWNPDMNPPCFYVPWGHLHNPETWPPAKTEGAARL